MVASSIVGSMAGVDDCVAALLTISWHMLRYIVFDSPHPLVVNCPFEDRYSILLAFLSTSKCTQIILTTRINCEGHSRILYIFFLKGVFFECLTIARHY